MQPYMTLHLLEDPYYDQLTSFTFMGRHKVTYSGPTLTYLR